MNHFLKAAGFLLQDLAATLVFAILFALTRNTGLAALVGMALGMLMIGIQVIRRKPVHAMEWLSLVIVMAAGTGALLTDDPRFVLIKPTVVYAAIGVVMLRRGWMLRYLPEIARRVAPDVATGVGYAWAGLMFVTAAVNAVVAMGWDVLTWAWVMAVFGAASKVLVFLAGFAAVRLTVGRRLRAMPPEEREALLVAAA